MPYYTTLLLDSTTSVLSSEERQVRECLLILPNRFNTFFTHLDNYKDSTFLYLTSGGIKATKQKLVKEDGEAAEKKVDDYVQESDGEEAYASDN